VHKDIPIKLVGRLSSYVERLKAVADELEQLKANVRHPVVLQCERRVGLTSLRTAGSQLSNIRMGEGERPKHKRNVQRKNLQIHFCGEELQSLPKPAAQRPRGKAVEDEIIVPRKIISGGIE
jgi:hypothetical protein